MFASCQVKYGVLPNFQVVHIPPEPASSAPSPSSQPRSGVHFQGQLASTRSAGQTRPSLPSTPGQDQRLTQLHPAAPSKETQTSASQPLLPRTTGAESEVQGSPDRLGCLPFRDVTMAMVLEDLRSLRFWRAVVGELLGTALLVLVGCGSTLTLASREQIRRGEGFRPTMVQIALCFGLAVATVVWALGHVSGGHVNPAVTVGHLVARKISLARCVLYVGAQMLGSVVGAALLWAITPEHRHGSLGATVPAPWMTSGQAVGLELLITFVLVFVVFASTDEKRRDIGGSKPLTIGLSVTACHLFAIPYTGSSMNSARSFGPSAIMGIWTRHWVYWVGPLAGGILAALLYEHVFAVNASMDKLKGFVLTRQYSGDKFNVRPQRMCIIEEVTIEGADVDEDPHVWNKSKKREGVDTSEFRQKNTNGVVCHEETGFMDKESNV